MRKSIKERYAKMVGSSAHMLLSLGRGIILLGIVFVIVSPILSIISDAIMDQQDVYNPLVFLIPANFTTENFQIAWSNMNYVRTFVNTIALAFAAMILQVFVCSLTGYGFARFRFPGRGILFALVIVTIVIPVQSYMVSMFAQFQRFGIFDLRLNLLNTVAPVLLLSGFGMGLRSGLYIYIFRQFFRGLPKEIEEAALIDGAGWLRTYLRVMMPNAMSAIITVSVFSFVWQYNDTFYAGMFMQQIALLPVRLVTLPNFLISQIHVGEAALVSLVVSAGILLAVIPVVLMYFGIQRMFMEGVERSGIVG